MSEEFIVKIQVAIAYSGDIPQMLVYNEDRSVMWEEPLNPEFKKLMRNRHKAFYWASIVGTKLAINKGKEARDPGW